MQASEFRQRWRRRLIEWFASKDIENSKDAVFRLAIRPIPAFQQQEETQKLLSLPVLPPPRRARAQEHP